ncbi:MAG TPA: SDR family NAD(P)-dependent oxidoreductase [Casimicrobiaceae bacterium]|nr:SDR family NAD(P)-dependent oxidoreductase [Casimicrobiaceae bacterium]
MAERVAVVTGVSKGLGAALARSLVEQDYDVIGVGRSAAHELASSRFRLVPSDLGDLEALPAIVDALFAELARANPKEIVVINNAAVASPAGTIGILDAAEASASMNVNLIAPAIIANSFVRAFADSRTQQRLINVSSGAATQAIPGIGLYCAAKAGLEMLTRIVAAESRAGVTAITVRPGVIDTPMQTSIRSQSKERVPSVDMFHGFHASGQLQSAQTTAKKIVERLVLGAVENGRVYSYAEL